MKFNSKYSLRGMKYALTCNSNRLMYKPMAILVAAGGVCFYFDNLVAGTLLVLFAIAGFALLLKGGLDEYVDAELNGKLALLTQWAKEGASSEECDARLAMLQTGDINGLFDSTGLTYDGPRYNFDGTPMLPGNSMLDNKGHLYGLPGLSSATFDSDTQLWADPSNAYENPLDTSMGSCSGLDHSLFDGH